MGDLDAPQTIEELYDARASEVTLARPILQGDVFEGLGLSDLGTESDMAMVLTHACSMRSGPGVLNERLTVAPVIARQVIPLSKWSSGHYNYMPLPELLRAGDSGFYCTDFRLTTALASESLNRKRRVACLSAVGLQFLLQRHVWHFTRVAVDLDAIDEALSPVLTEAELSQDWVEAAARAGALGLDDLPSIEQEEIEFQRFLGDSSSSLRASLKERRLHPSVRRAVRSEIRERFGE